jgi:hypothetical protein
MEYLLLILITVISTYAITSLIFNEKQLKRLDANKFKTLEKKWRSLSNFCLDNKEFLYEKYLTMSEDTHMTIWLASLNKDWDDSYFGHPIVFFDSRKPDRECIDIQFKKGLTESQFVCQIYEFYKKHNYE